MSRLVIKSSLQGGFLMGLGDLISQSVVEKNEKIDLIRLGRFTLIGFGVGPMLHRWYHFLDGRFVSLGPKSKILAKIATDQSLFAPVLIGAIMSSNMGLKGHALSSIKNELVEDYPTVMLNNYKLWPVAQLINFSFVPLQYRALYTQVIAVFWNCYLAWKTNRPKYKEPISTTRSHLIKLNGE